jgi:hypothetical protein
MVAVTLAMTSPTFWCVCVYLDTHLHDTSITLFIRECIIHYIIMQGAARTKNAAAKAEEGSHHPPIQTCALSQAKLSIMVVLDAFFKALLQHSERRV